jgi:hypothetical protein
MLPIPPDSWKPEKAHIYGAIREISAELDYRNSTAEGINEIGNYTSELWIGDSSTTIEAEFEDNSNSAINTNTNRLPAALPLSLNDNEDRLTEGQEIVPALDETQLETPVVVPTPTECKNDGRHVHWHIRPNPTLTSDVAPPAIEYQVNRNDIDVGFDEFETLEQQDGFMINRDASESNEPQWEVNDDFDIHETTAAQEYNARLNEDRHNFIRDAPPNIIDQTPNLYLRDDIRQRVGSVDHESSLLRHRYRTRRQRNNDLDCGRDISDLLVYSGRYE